MNQTVEEFNPNTKENLLEDLRQREQTCWVMAKVFYDNRDAHGIHDMGVEIQALQRAIMEIVKLEDVE